MTIERKKEESGRVHPEIVLCRLASEAAVLLQKAGREALERTKRTYDKET